jgi:hypothetical protein
LVPTPTLAFHAMVATFPAKVSVTPRSCTVGENVSGVRNEVPMLEMKLTPLSSCSAPPPEPVVPSSTGSWNVNVTTADIVSVNDVGA